MLSQTPPPTIVDVIDVYGVQRRINQLDYDSGRVQLRLYTKRGTAYQFLSGLRESTTIHRDNIAVIDGQTIRPFAPSARS